MPEIKISAVLGNQQCLDGGAMFGNVPRAMWSSWHQPDDQGRIPLNCRAMLIEIGSTKILCETGIGAFFEPKLAHRFGVIESEHILLRSLADLGISHEDIDIVVLSHLHFDHAGGLLEPYTANKASELLFPRATFVTSKLAFERACKPHMRDRASFIPGLTDKLLATKRLKLIDGASDAALYPEHLSFYFSNGHTPGQMLTMIKGNNRSLLFAGDLVPGLAWIHLPITMGYDRNAEMVIDEKAKLYENLLQQNCELFFTHDPNYASAILVRNGDKYAGVEPVTSMSRVAV